MADHPIRAVHSGDVSVGWIPVTGTWARPCCPALSTDCLPVRCGDQFRRLATGTVGEAIPYGTDAGCPVGVLQPIMKLAPAAGFRLDDSARMAHDNGRELQRLLGRTPKRGILRVPNTP